jgi:hypothetical protein
MVQCRTITWCLAVPTKKRRFPVSCLNRSFATHCNHHTLHATGSLNDECVCTCVQEAARGIAGVDEMGGSTLQGAGRRLQQSTVVTTAEELQQAILNDTQHIEIKDHLDLTTLSLIDPWRVLGVIPMDKREIGNQTWVQSIRVCTAHEHLIDRLRMKVAPVPSQLCTLHCPYKSERQGICMEALQVHPTSLHLLSSQSNARAQVVC